MVALEQWDLEEVKEYLSEDASLVNQRDSTTGRSLLHEACAVAQKHVVVYLLDHYPCDLASTTILGRASCLHLAVQAANRSIVFWLLSYGANATATDRFGSTPLHYCTKRTIAQHLIQFGAKALTANRRRQTAALAIKSNPEADADLKEYIASIAATEVKQRKSTIKK